MTTIPKQGTKSRRYYDLLKRVSDSGSVDIPKDKIQSLNQFRVMIHLTAATHFREKFTVSAKSGIDTVTVSLRGALLPGEREFDY